MTEVLKLGASKREQIGSNAMRRLRRGGRVPAVLYGHGEQVVNLDLDARQFRDALVHHARFVELEFGGAVESALIREVQYDTFGQNALHVDFVRASLHEKLEIEVSITLKGLAVGVTKENGVLEQVTSDVLVLCSPRDLPDTIEVNVSALSLGQAIHVRDLPGLPGVEYLDDPEKIVCVVSQVRVEAPAETAPAEGAAEPEVVGAADKKDGDKDQGKEPG